MNKYSESIQIRWADIDANRHLRHSVYYDYAASMRMNFLIGHGLTSEKMEELQIGPILFREEAIFRREIRLENKIILEVELLKATPDFSRWSLRHHFFKDDGVIACILNIDGAWIDLQKRKLAIPNVFVKEVFEKFPKSKDFEWTIPERKL
jgi:acyl-CoA thioester hydrolase